MNTRVSVSLVTAILCCLPACSHAAITAFWVPIASGDGSVGTMYPAAAHTPPGGDPVLLGMQTWDLKVTTDGDWQFGGLRATLSTGAFYNSGGNTRPNPALFFVFPALEFDTYVTAPGDTGSSGIGAPSILGGFPMNEPFSLSGHVLSVSWGELINDPPSPPPGYQIARLTFPLGAIPDILTIDQNPEFSRTSQVNPDSTTAIPEIPEPSVMGLLIAAGLMAIARVNKR